MNEPRAGGWWQNKISLEQVRQDRLVQAAPADSSSNNQDPRLEILRGLFSALVPAPAPRMGTARRLRAGYVRFLAAYWRSYRHAFKERSEQEFADALGIDRSTFSLAVQHFERLIGTEQTVLESRRVILTRRESSRQKMPGPSQPIPKRGSAERRLAFVSRGSKSK